MTRGFWYGVFMPGQNRYYADRRLYRLAYFLRWSPIVILLLIFAVMSPSAESLGLLVGLLAIIAVDYLVIRKYSEKFMWNFIFKRFYKDDLSISSDYEAIKRYDQDPSEFNRDAILKMQEKSK